MALIVQKYGGSSVADSEKILNVARRVTAAASGDDRGSGHRLVVVVSAMGKTTDGLVALAHRITPTPAAREMDMLLATGSSRPSRYWPWPSTPSGSRRGPSPGSRSAFAPTAPTPRPASPGSPPSAFVGPSTTARSRWWRASRG